MLFWHFAQFQKKLSKLEEQLSNELQAKDELEQKYRWDCFDMFDVLINFITAFGFEWLKAL